MRPLFLLLVMWPAMGFCAPGFLHPQDEKAAPTRGIIKIIFGDAKEGTVPHLSVHVLRAMDPTSEAALQADFSIAGLIENMDEIFDHRYPDVKVEDVEKAEKENTVTLSLKPGTYHVIVRQGKGSGVWLTDLKVAAGQTIEREVTLLKPGSVRGTWTIDLETVPENQPRGFSSIHAALFRDGRVWAAAYTDVKKKFAIDEIPPGTYTLVVADSTEGFTSITENVVIQSGKEYSAKLSIRIDKEVYFIARFMNKRTQADIPLDSLKDRRIALIDTKHGIPILGNYSSVGVHGQKDGWRGLPAGLPYTLSILNPKFNTIEKMPAKTSRYTEKPRPGQPNFWIDQAEVQPVFLVPTE